MRSAPALLLALVLPLAWPLAAAGDPLQDVNEAFRALYRQAKVRKLQDPGPVLLVLGDRMVVVDGEKREEASLRSAEYHALKSIAHIPLALQVALSPDPGQPLSSRTRAALEGLRVRLEDLEPRLEDQGFTAAQAKRQAWILGQSRAFLDRVLEREQVSAADLRAFTRRMAPAVRKNVDEAAKAQLQALHDQVEAFRESLGAAAWAKVQVVVSGSHMAREGNVALQYFLRRLHEPKEGRRVVFAEGLWEPDQAPDLLATHRVDRAIGADFFGDPDRMHRDLLADAAEAELKRMGF